MHNGPQDIRPRQVRLQAMQLTQTNMAIVLSWIERVGKHAAIGPGDRSIDLFTDLGPRVAEPGDYLVRDLDGEIWPVHPWQFEQLYEAPRCDGPRLFEPDGPDDCDQFPEHQILSAGGGIVGEICNRCAMLVQPSLG